MIYYKIFRSDCHVSISSQYVKKYLNVKRLTLRKESREKREATGSKTNARDFRKARQQTKTNKEKRKMKRYEKENLKQNLNVERLT